MQNLKIVFMGTPEFAACSLKALIDAGYEIPLVITQPDRKGNRNKMILSPVRQLALDCGIETAQPIRLRRDKVLIERLRSVSPDMIVVAAFGQILPRSVLEIPRLGCINVHGSLLPDLRGASPMQGAILKGLDESGVTIMRMEEGLDTGDMISKVRCDIRGKDIVEVSQILADAGSKLLIETIPHIADGTAVYEKQDDSLSSYAKMINKKDGMTDFTGSAEEIERMIRAYLDWPTCYSYLEGLQRKFFRAEALMDQQPDGEPGTISETGKDFYIINCREGKLKIYEQQLQGKKRMGAGDFMRGHRLNKGDRFTAIEQ